MKVKISRLAINKYFTENYYWIIFTIYAISMFFLDISVGVIAAILMVVICLTLDFTSVKLVVKRDKVITLYILFNACSLLCYIYNGKPISLFFTEFAYSILPIVFYFVAVSSAHSSAGKYVDAIIYSYIISVIMYVWAPGFYGEYLVYRGFISRNHPDWIRSSIQGIYGITAIGTFSAVVFIYAYWKVIFDKHKRYIVTMILGMFMLLWCQRRSAMLACLVMFLFENIIICIKVKEHRARIKKITIFLVICVVVFYFFNIEMVKEMMSKLMHITEAFGERNSNWMYNLKDPTNNWLIGTGLGSRSHLAGKYGYLGVYDCSYIKMIVENGIVGLLLFLSIIIQKIYNFVKIENKNYVAFCIVIIFLIQAIGSNVLNFQILAPLFWYALGKMSKKEI